MSWTQRGSKEDWSWARVADGHYIWHMGQFQIMRDGRKWALIGPGGSVIGKYGLMIDARREAREMFKERLAQQDDVV